jgi:hypothetical protein
MLVVCGVSVLKDGTGNVYVAICETGAAAVKNLMEYFDRL